MSAHPLHPAPCPPTPPPSSQLDLLSLSAYLSAFQTLLFLNIAGLESYSHLFQCFLCFQIPENSLQQEKVKPHIPVWQNLCIWGFAQDLNFYSNMKCVSLNSTVFSCVEQPMSKLNVKKASCNCGDTNYIFARKQAL